MVWKKILLADMTHDFFRLSIENWVSLIIQSHSLDTSWKIGVCITCWKLWETRNKSIFANGDFVLDGFLAQVKAIVVHTEQ